MAFSMPIDPQFNQFVCLDCCVSVWFLSCVCVLSVSFYDSWKFPFLECLVALRKKSRLLCFLRRLVHLWWRFVLLMCCCAHRLTCRLRGISCLLRCLWRETSCSSFFVDIELLKRVSRYFDFYEDFAAWTLFSHVRRFEHSPSRMML